MASAADYSVTKANWVIHEWGTFTSLQDEDGRTIGGINTDDEPVPKFVHRLSDWILVTPTQVPVTFFQGAPHCHPDVTMRLETPVIYFHPPPGATNEKINVKVKFNGGWLTEFYPRAETNPEALDGDGSNVIQPGGNGPSWQFGHLTGDTISYLDWQNLKVGGDAIGPATDYHVWNAPRNVQAASVETVLGETEKFLFYRGVAHIDAPLRISRNGEKLLFRSQLEGDLSAARLPVTFLWLVDIQPDGEIAFRTLPAVTLAGDTNKILASVKADFRKSDYREENLEELKTSLRKTLVAEGLFKDEADALLNTWELSYFKSAGTRVFFIVPRAWTDHYLPLEISVPAEVNRVMVGRIELITPRQRETLQEMAQFSQEQISKDWKKLHESFYGSYNRLYEAKEIEKVDRGGETLAQARIEVPATYQKYLDLGRFRNTLVLDELSRRPTEGLTDFVSSYGLHGYNFRESNPN